MLLACVCDCLFARLFFWVFGGLVFACDTLFNCVIALFLVSGGLVKDYAVTQICLPLHFVGCLV